MTEQTPPGYHVVTLYTDADGMTFAKTHPFESHQEAKAYFTKARHDAQSSLHAVRRRAVWLYQINPLDGRREEADAWISDWNDEIQEQSA